MINPESTGQVVGQIDVEISYRIIELFSAGLYSSPNKAFEELVANAYDADAGIVGVGVPADIDNDDFLWVLDNGIGMDSDGLKDLWKIGESKKRTDRNTSARVQIGQFGIGKLSTFILASKLTYISKKNSEYRSVTMDFSALNNASRRTELVQLEERKLEEKDVQPLIEQYVVREGADIGTLTLFGDNAEETWTFSLMTMLKSRAKDIKTGRLKWVLSTALPLNPGFKLFYNGTELESSKISVPIENEWILGKDDQVVEKNPNYTARKEGDRFFVSLSKLQNIHGEMILYKESLAKGKSDYLARSYGVFLMVRNRLINVDASLLPGMSQIAHGAINKARLVVHADELDPLITSTRESIKESPPYLELKDYLTAKLNELHAYWLGQKSREEKRRDVAHSLSVASYTLTREPIYKSSILLVRDSIEDATLIDSPKYEESSEVEDFIHTLKEDVESDRGLIQSYGTESKSPSCPICRLDLLERTLYINMLHPFVLFCLDSANDFSTIHAFAAGEVLHEAELINSQLDGRERIALVNKRDMMLREIVSDAKENPATIAQMIADSEDDADKLESAAVAAFNCLGFETLKQGGSGKPDAIAYAHLGSSDGRSSAYKIIIDTKSTRNPRNQTGNIHVSSIDNHRIRENADFAVIVAKGYQGVDDKGSLINTEAKKFSRTVTLMTTKDLITLVRISGPKQVGLRKYLELFQQSESPKDTTDWINKVESSMSTPPPYKQIIQEAYRMQKGDSEMPTISSMRISSPVLKKYSIKDISRWVKILARQVPGYISLSGDVVSLNMNPENIMKALRKIYSDYPPEYREMYGQAFGVE